MKLLSIVALLFSFHLLAAEKWTPSAELLSSFDSDICIKGDVSNLEKHLKSGMNPDERHWYSFETGKTELDPKGATLLRTIPRCIGVTTRPGVDKAARKAVDLLIAHGADLNAYGRTDSNDTYYEENTPLMGMGKCGDCLEGMKYLIEKHNADPNFAYELFGDKYTVLERIQDAVARGRKQSQVDSTRYLLFEVGMQPLASDNCKAYDQAHKNRAASANSVTTAILDLFNQKIKEVHGTDDLWDILDICDELQNP
ncbi:MAG: hypothetical protein EP319_14590 [Deltaproteobacteria bacterium]|nr:MAG: hypothetical protein EP319_14590 [Deltaproteobacteria bacterium]